jgi:hypothetical protein
VEAIEAMFVISAAAAAIAIYAAFFWFLIK